jgi:hypothetical protein
MSKNDLRQKRYAKDGKGQAERRLPAEYDCLAALVRFAGLLYRRADAARHAIQAYQNYVAKMAQLNEPLADPETRETVEEELENSLSLWTKIGEPIWKDALKGFPLHGVLDAVALPATGGGALTKFEDIGELLEAMLAIDECLRFIAKKAAEKDTLPFTLPQSPFVAPRIQIMPDGRSRVAQDLLHDAILPALAVEVSRDPRQPHGPDARRLKICPVCDRLFVAKRQDQTSCSGQCANTNRQRCFRDRDKQREYKEHHRKNQLAKAARARLRAERMFETTRKDKRS